MRSDLLRLVGDGLCREQYRRAGRDGLPAGEPAETERDAGSVAGHHPDLGRLDAELARGDLRERGAEPLTHRGSAGEHRDAAGARDAHKTRLERAAAAALDAVRQPDAEVT